MGEKRKLLSVDLEDVGLRGDLMSDGLHGVGDVAEIKRIRIVQAAGMVGQAVTERLELVAERVKVPGDNGQVDGDRSGDRVTSLGLVG